MIENNESMKYKVLNLLVDDPTAILLFKNKYIDDDVWKFCIEREPGIFKHMKAPNEQMCEFALGIDGHNLKYIRKKFTDIKITRKMAYIATNNCPKSIMYVPEEILDEGLKEKAFSADPSLLQNFEFKDLRYDYIKNLINENPACIKYINNPPDDLILEAIKRDSNVCVYFEKLSPRVMAVINEINPDLLLLYKNIEQ